MVKVIPESILMNRSDFPLFKLPGRHDYAYLDSAATTIKPQKVIDAVTHVYTTFSGSPRRGLYSDSENATASIEQVRETVSQFLGVESNTILFTKNTTDSINTVALSWGEKNIQAGDEIVVTAREHHANFIPWQQLAHRKQARLVVIPVDQNGELVENCCQYITSSTKLLALGHVSNVTGVISKFLEQLVAQAKRFSAAVLLDGAQAVSYIEHPLQQLDPDFYVFSGHKMCGPYDVGILYVKKSRHSEIQPYAFGGGSVREVSQDLTTFLPFPYSFEPGTLATPEIIGLGAAVEYLQSIGVTNIANHANALVRLFLDSIDHAKIIIVGDNERLYNESHLVSFVVQGYHAHDVAAYLAEKGIAVRAGNHCAQPLHKTLGYDATVRVSFYMYNTETDVIKCVKALNELVK